MGNPRPIGEEELETMKNSSSSRPGEAELQTMEQSLRPCAAELETRDHMKQAELGTMRSRGFSHVEQSLRSCRSEFEAMWSRARDDAEQSGAELETMRSRARGRVEQSSRLCRSELQDMWTQKSFYKKDGCCPKATVPCGKGPLNWCIMAAAGESMAGTPGWQEDQAL